MSQVLSTKLLEILACPEDKGPLFYLADENLLYNPRLKRAYLVIDGIPVMLESEARALGGEPPAPSVFPDSRLEEPASTGPADPT